MSENGDHYSIIGTLDHIEGCECHMEGDTEVIDSECLNPDTQVMLREGFKNIIEGNLTAFEPRSRRTTFKLKQDVLLVILFTWVLGFVAGTVPGWWKIWPIGTFGVYTFIYFAFWNDRNNEA